VTVLIPCRDEAALIRRKIQNSLRLRYPDPALGEILLVDDASRDRTVEIIEAEIAAAGGNSGPRLRLARNRYEAGKAGAIRTGIEEATGDVVLLTDADTLIEKEALVRALACFEDPRTGVVCGEQVYCDQLPPGASEAPGDASNALGGALMDPPGRREGVYDWVMRTVRRTESRLDSTFAVHGQMALFRRSLGLVPRAGVAADDVDLSLQARRKGFRIRYAQGARFWEERPRSLVAEARQKKRRGMSLAQVLWVNRDMLARPRYGAFGMLSLPFQWTFLLAQPIGLALLLTLGLATAVVRAPLAGAVGVAALGGLLAGSKSVRSYLLMNATMLSAIVSLLAGQSLTDRWPRDRDAGPERGSAGTIGA
jgi:cellulose synthase/poly-beta-1,6-N-acetylglucosamine synthase-like glycosyltransferase